MLDETLQPQLLHAKEHAARCFAVGDEIAVVVDVLSEPPLHMRDPRCITPGYVPPIDKDPGLITAKEHIDASEEKLARYFAKRSIEEYVERGAFIGPFVTVVGAKPSQKAIEYVRIGFFVPRIRY